MDVADACCQEINAQISYHLALLGIRALAHSDHAVLFAADGTNLCLDGKSLLMSSRNQLLGLGNVLFDRIVRSVEHDGGESGFDALVAGFISAVVQMQSNRNGDVQLFEHSVYHSNYGLITGHILSCALGNAEDDGRIQLLSRLKDGFRPLQIVDVELTDCIVAGFRLVEHFFC